MSYRAELAKSGRSTCTATACKNEGIKIEKGELRHGVLVTIRENTSMKYRHWGCVTPQVLHNWKETCGMDMELVDGYDELPADAQAKVKRALEQEHVDDDEWNGDIECNRYVEGKKNQGMFLKTPKKGSKKANDEDEGDESPAKKKKQPAKKRARDEDEDEQAETEPAAKKTKGRAKKAPKAEESEDEPAPVKKSKKSKAAAPADSDKPAATKPARSKKAKQQPVPDVPEDDEVLVPTKAKSGKSKQSKAKAQTKQDQEAEDPPKAAPKRKGRGRKAATFDED